MDGWHHRPSVARAPQRGAARAGASRSAQARAATSSVADRRLSAIHPRDAGNIPDADGQPPLCDGARAWLSRQSRSLPPCHRLPSASTESRSLSASAQPPWRTSAGGLGPLGHLEIGRARRPLMAFVMVLSYSRQIFLRFFADARMENFLRGHVAAFTAWHGVPRVILYDNLKSAVLERYGAAIRFH